MRCCHIVSGDLWAGAEVMACHLLKELHNKAVFDIFVIVLNEGRLAQELRSAGLNIHIMDETQYSFFQLYKKIYKFLKVHNTQIIHSHRYKENLLAWLASHKINSCRLVTTQHGLPESHHEKASFVGRMKLHANFYVMKHHFHKVVAVSNDICRHFTEQLRFSPKNVNVVHNGIEIPVTVNEKKSEDNFIVGSSGRLFPVKDYPLMVKVAAMLKDYEDIRFALAGDGPERQMLGQLAEQNRITDRFAFHGHLDLMEPFYQELDVYLNTSIHEGIPMTILEAMSYGLPIVAPRVGGIPEVVEHGVEGFLADSRDPSDFADKCLLLARDSELWKRMSVAARKRAVEAFSVERMTEGYLRLYEELLR